MSTRTIPISLIVLFTASLAAATQIADHDALIASAAAEAAAREQAPSMDATAAKDTAVPLHDWKVPEVKTMQVYLQRGVAMATVPSNPSTLVTVVPCRIVDTRNAAGPFGGPRLVGGTPRSFPIPTSTTCTGIPATAAAYSVNVTVFAPDNNGFLSVFPTGGSTPVVSTLNYATFQTIPNAAVVPAGTSGAISVFSTANADVIIDINGYFVQNGPIAYANVNAAGTVVSGTPNVVGCPYNAPSTRYECTITGVNYFFSSFATVITPIDDDANCTSSSVGGKLLVYCRNSAGTIVQTGFGFSFVIFQP